MDEIDKHGMKSVIASFPTQITEAWKLAADIKFEDIDYIIIAGMGGSALPGEILKSYLFNKFKYPIEIIRNYELPEYINSKTLVIASSYSGDTEETLDAFRQANRKGCALVAITSGGKLEKSAKDGSIPIVKIPSGIQPRMAIGYTFFPMLRILQNSGLIADQHNVVRNTSEHLRNDIFKEKAIELAEKISGKIPIIYTSERLRAISYKWKINFNENCKIHAFYNVFSELNHNEMLGYTKPNGKYFVLIIKDDFDDRRIKKRMELTKKIIQKANCPVLDIELTGSSDLQKIFSAIYLGDWTSYFTALNMNIDPTPIDMIEKFKQEL